MPLFSILLTDREDEELSDLVSENIRSLRSRHPGEEHLLWRETMLTDFIASHFDAEVLSAFRTLRPYAYKADLAKYCLLYEHGGLYADLLKGRVPAYLEPIAGTEDAVLRLYRVKPE